MKGLKKLWGLNGVLLENGDSLRVECEPRERYYIKENFIFKDDYLISKKGIKLEVDSI